jgi:hypothetical protein
MVEKMKAKIAELQARKQSLENQIDLIKGEMGSINMKIDLLCDLIKEEESLVEPATEAPKFAEDVETVAETAASEDSDTTETLEIKF